MNGRRLTTDLVVFFFVALLSGGPCLAGSPPAELWQSIRSASLDTSSAVQVQDVMIELERGQMRLRDGVLIPAGAQEGRVFELVFVGKASFLFKPPDNLERQQLELFTRRSELDVDITQVVLAIGDEAIVRQLLDRPPFAPSDSSALESAEAAYGTWVESAERRGFGADAAILQSALGDDLYGKFFVAWCRSEDVGDFYYTFDPGEQEQITLGQFVPVEADDLEEYRIRKRIRKGQRQGYFRQVRFEDLGDWDTWVSSALTDPSGNRITGGPAFEPKHHTLEATIDPKQESMTGKTRVDIVSEKSGRRVVPFTLFSELKVKSVTNAEGQPLTWLRSGEDILVVLDEPSVKDAEFSLSIAWYGKALVELEKGGTLALRDTYSWYPRLGAVHRATYDATIRWPKKYELLASGRVVNSGEEAGQRWEKRLLDVPAFAFSFEIGDFDVHRAQAGRVELTVAFSKVSGSLDKGAKQEVIDKIADSLAFLESRFGDYPLDHLTVVTVPRGFSQGFLGFVTLSHFLLWDRGSIWADELREVQRTETIAHELSHQWWGNKVGWDSYRDQWLSEALADFSATLYAAHKAERKSVYLARHARDWKAALSRSAKDGRSVESVGPVVMGERLSSSQSGRAYTAVVYRKGSVVVNMLSKALGPEPFAGMLKALSDAVNNRVIDTPTFISAIERMSGLPLGDFASRFIYGTGVPEVYYNYEFVKGEDGWKVAGTARQVSRGHDSYMLQRTDAETWHVARSRSVGVDVDDSVFIVPFQISLSGAEDKKADKRSVNRRVVTQTGLGGAVILEGAVTEFEFAVPRKPDSFWLDQRGETLAHFYCEQRQPKRMLRYRAQELAGAGDYEEAEKLYSKALTEPLYSEDAGDVDRSKKQIERSSTRQDALIHIHMARMYVDRGKPAEASVALDETDKLLTGLDKNWYKGSRDVLRAQLAVEVGDYKSAYNSLSKIAYLEFPYLSSESLADGARRQKFKSRNRYRLSGRGYALLAVSAFETGHEEVALQALKRAQELNTDMAALASLISG